MYSARLENGTINLNVPEEFKFLTVKDWLKTLGKDAYSDMELYATIGKFLDEYFPDTLNTDQGFMFVMCSMFLIKRFQMSFEDIKGFLLNNSLITEVYVRYLLEHSV